MLLSPPKWIVVLLLGCLLILVGCSDSDKNSNSSAAIEENDESTLEGALADLNNPSNNSGNNSPLPDDGPTINNDDKTPLPTNNANGMGNETVTPNNAGNGEPPPEEPLEGNDDEVSPPDNSEPDPPTSEDPPSEDLSTIEPPFQQAKSDLERLSAETINELDYQELIRGNNEFAFDIYAKLIEESSDNISDNIFYSPYSISSALAMVYAGARSYTAVEMATALRFTLPEDRFHTTFNALDLNLQSLDGEVTLNITNDLWGQIDFPFHTDFLDTLSLNYGAGINSLNFMSEPEASRLIINNWISQQTNQKIKDLLPRGSVGTLTRLVLTNAIYFKGDWLEAFKEQNTQDHSFTLLDGSSFIVPFMSQQETFNYTSGQGYQAIELDYKGEEMSMVIILPDEGQIENFETNLTYSTIEAIINELSPRLIQLKMPKFEIEAEFSLASALMRLGMVSAFSGAADFSGIANASIAISSVIHKAYIAVDEKGTEAAAATGVVVGVVCACAPVPLYLTLDHPFIYLIRDKTSDSILFMGRMMKPEQAENE